MNKIYRVVWNETSQTAVAVMETAKAHGQRGSALCTGGTAQGSASVCQLTQLVLALAWALGGAVPALAGPPAPTELPTGAQVVAGQATVTQPGAAVLQINQSSQAAVINWQSFNLGSAASVHFAQPSASSTTLNRVLDSNPSQIYGRITAPGQVFFTNPAGMYFGPGSSVDVGGLVATTHSISDADFMAGNYQFARNGASGSIVNAGELKASLGGYIALLAPEVRNQGVIVAQMGTVALAAGELVTLQMLDTQLASLRVSPATIQTLVDNASAVRAPGGLIILSAQAADQLQGSVVNNSGTLAATGLALRNGRVVLDAGSNGAITVSGNVSAAHTDGKGGDITLTGQDIHLQSGAVLDASGSQGGGTVLVGGDWQGSGPLPQATHVTMDSGASIDVRALQSGDGGKAVLWSDLNLQDGYTNVHGSIAAAGGTQGGNGGQIETSGHHVDLGGVQVNAGAAQGNGGQWLIDPFNYTITATEALTIKTALQSGANVIVDTNNATATGAAVSGVSGAGDITVSSAIAKTSGGNASLTLTAGNNIVLNAGISSITGTLTTTLNAGGGISGTGAINTNGGLLTLNAATTGTLSGVISGTGGLTKSGAGTTTLTAVNSYTGNTTIAAGTLTLNSVSTSVNHNIAAGAVLEYNMSSDTDLLNKTYTGGGTLRKSGAGSIYWGTGRNGTFSLGAGSLIDVQGGAFQASWNADEVWTNNLSDLFVASGTTFKADVAAIRVNAVNGSGAITASINGYVSGPFTMGVANGSGVFTGTIANATAVARIVKEGTGTQILAGNNTYTGGTTISGGTLQVGNGGTTGTLGTGAVTNNAALVYNRSNALTQSTAISGTGSVTQAGTGTTTLSGANTYTGATVVNSGTLQAGSSSAFGNNSAVTLANTAGATLNFNGFSQSIGSLAGGGSTGGNVSLGTATLTTGANGTSTSFGGVISGTGGLIKEGTGTQTLTGNNTYGATTINAGTLQIGDGGNSGSLGTGAVTDNAALVFNRAADTTISNTISGSGTVDATITGNLTVGGTVTQSNTVNLQASQGLTLNANLTSAGGTTLASGGSLALNANITNNGTGAVTLRAGDGSAASAATLTAAASATITQNADANVELSTDGTGDLTPAKILKTASGAGNIVLAAGKQIAAGTGSGGQVTPLSGNSVGNSGSGTLYVYSGNIAGTGNLSLLSAGLGSLNYNGTTAGAINTAFSSAYGSSISNGPATQLLVRETPGAPPAFNIALGNTNFSKTYGNADPSAAALSTAIQSVYTGPATLTTSYGGKTFVLAAADVLADLTASRTAGENVGSYAYSGWTSGAGLHTTVSNAPSVNLQINQRDITLTSLSAANKTYDGNTNASITSGVFGNLAGTETLGLSGSGTFADKNAATGTTVTVADVTALTRTDGTGAWSNYHLTTTGSATTSANIAKKTVTLTAGPVSKTYDGLTSYSTAAGDLGALSSQLGIAGDTVTAATIAYTDKNAGTGNKTVTLNSATVSDGNSGGNYAITLAGNSSSTISQRDITLTSLNAANKTYDGNNAASITAGNFSNLAGTESLGLSGSGTFADKNAATGKTVTVADVTTLTRTDGTGAWSNYHLTTTGSATTSANIAKKTVTLTAGNVTKTYDGLLGYTTQAADLSTLSSQLGVGGDSVSAASIAYLDKNAATGTKTVTLNNVGISDGNSGNNYAITLAGNSSSTISQRDITLTSLSAANKTYDGNNSASITAGVFGNLAGTETLGLSGSGTFADKNAATGTTVTVADVTALTRTDGTGAWSNYHLTTTGSATTSADIAKKAVTLTAGNVSKTYDGLTSYSTAAGDLSALSSQLGIAGDTVTAATIAYTDKNAGTGNKTVTLNSVGISDGNSGGNYSLTLAGNTSSTIGKASATVTGNTDTTRIYNGTTQSVTGFSASGLVNGETISVLTGVSASGSGRNAGSYAVVPTGTDGNYNLSFVNGNLQIAQKAVTLTAGNVTKTYDGLLAYTTQAADLSTLSGQLGVSGDTVSTATIAYTDKNAGTGNKTVTLSNVALSDGNGGANYSVTLAGNSSSTIGKASATVTGNSDSTRVYDGRTQTVSGFSATGLVNGETASVLTGVSASGSGRNAGSYAVVPTGTDGNYSLSMVNGTLQIAKKAVTLTASSVSKTYDGLLAYTTQAADLSALSSQLGVGGDSVSAASITYLDKNAGSGKTVALNSVGISDGNSGANYAVTLVGNSSSTIAKASATVTGASDSTRVYDGTTQTLTGFSATGLVNGETASVLTGVSASGSGRNAGSYAVVPTGTDGNYNLSFVNGNLQIAKKAVTLTAGNVSKTYDSLLSYTTQAADLSTLSSQLGVGSDSVATATIAYTDKNAGSGNKTVTLSNVALNDGNSGNNYTVTLAGNSGSSIAKASATVTANSDTARVYDGTTQSVTGFSATGLVNGETASVLTGVSASGSGRNAGSYVVTPTGSDGNYNLSFINGNLQIAKKAVTLTAGNVSKTYDGLLGYSTQAADLSALSSQLGVGGDSVSSASIAYLDKNAGSGNKSVTLGNVAINDGNSGANYTVALAGNNSSTITQRDITLSSLTVANKTYDGTTTASITGATFANLAGSETLGLSGSASFDNRNAGTGKTVTVADASTLVQTDGSGQWSNYHLSTSGSATATANVAQKAVTLTAGSVSKTYDGLLGYTTQAADLSTLSSQLGVAGDTVSAASIAYLDKNAGAAKTVALNSVGISDGNNGANYAVTLVGNSSSSIAKASATVTGASDSTRVYDGTTQTLSGFSATGLVNGETASVLSGVSASGSGRNAGSYAVVPTGTDGNYNLSFVDGTLQINRATLTAALTGSVQKTYDGLTGASNLVDSNFLLSGWVQGEGATLTQTSGNYASKHVDANTGTGMVSTSLAANQFSAKAGTDLNNYVLPTTASGAVGRITPAGLTVKVNDSATFVTLNPAAATDMGFSYDGLQNGESPASALGALSRSYTGSANPVAGNYSNVFGLATTPTAAHGNYTVSVVPGNLLVVQADKAIVNVSNSSASYGSLTAANAGASAQTVSVDYLTGGNTLAHLSMQSLGSGQWQASDRTASMTFFTQVNSSGALSTGGYLNKGNYTYGIGPVSGAAAGNFAGVVVNGGVLTVDPLQVSLAASNFSKVYDGSTALPGSGTLSAANKMAGDTLTVGYSGGSFAGKNAGAQNYTLTGASLGGADQANYALASSSYSGSGTISTRAVTLSASGLSKTYDGNSAYTATAQDLAQLSSQLGVAGDTVSAASAAFANANAGASKTVSTSAAVVNDGNGGANYAVSYADSANNQILKKAVSLTGISASSKTYDGNTSASISAGTVSGTVGSETLGISGSGSFADANAGAAKTVTVADVSTLTLVNGSGQWSNYQLSTTGSLSTQADINRRAITLTSLQAANKTYDGNTTASITGGTFSNLVGTETLGLGGSGSFDNRNAGSGKTVTVADVTALTQTNGSGLWSNYQLSSTGSQTSSADIAKKVVTLTAGNVSKTYDGLLGYTTQATDLSALSSQLGVGGDSVSAATIAYLDKNAGNGNKAVTLGNVVINDGNSGANYGVTLAGNSSSSITQRDITLTSLNAANKTYDGTTTASIIGATFANLAGSETLGLSGSASFGDRNAGTGKTVTVADVAALTQTDGSGQWSNYRLISSGSLNATADVAKKAVTLTAASVGKTYDGLTSYSSSAADLSALGSQLGVAGDTVSAASIAYLDKNAGAGKTVVLNSVGISDGNNGANYAVTLVGNSSTIAKASATVTGASDSTRVYDGTTQTLSGFSATGLVNGETASVLTGVSASGSGRNAGSYAVVPTGTDGNYNLSFVDGTLQINRATLTAALTGSVEKQYDGLTSVSNLGNANFSIAGWASGEGAAISQTRGSYASKNVSDNAGNGVVSTTLADNQFTPQAGTDLANCVLPVAASGAVGRITPAPLGVQVNSSTTFVTLDANSAPDLGMRFTGLQNGETAASVLGTLSRSYTGASATPAAGTYSGVFGLSSTPVAANGNYSVTVTKGNLVVVPADQLLITIGSESAVYDQRNASAAAATAHAVQVDYLAGGTTLAHLAMQDLGSGLWQATDSTGQTLRFSTLLSGAGTASSGGYLQVGNYTFGATAASGSALANFSGQVVNGGVLSVTPKVLAVSANNTSKTYDGSTALPALSLSPDGLLAGDVLAVGYGSGSFAGRNAGAQGFSLSGLTLGGADRANYALSSSSYSGTGSITPKSVTLSASGLTKTYDGTTAVATGSQELAQLSSALGVAGDRVTAATLAFVDAAAGNSKSVSTGAAVVNDGNGGANYQLAYANSSGNRILQKEVSLVSVRAAHKVYDGSTAADIVGGTLLGLVGSETLGVQGQGSFADRNAGTDKTVTVADVAALGAVDGTGLWSNYRLVSTGSLRTSASIAKKSVTLSPAGVTKTYDGLTDYRTQAADLLALSRQLGVDGDSVTAATLAYTDPNAGSGKTLTLAGVAVGDGNGGNNYTLALADSQSSTIAQAELLVRALDAIKAQGGGAYRGGNGVSYTGFVHGETQAVLDGTLTYGGNSQGAVTPGDYAIAAEGLSGRNYRLSYQPGTLRIVAPQTPAKPPTPPTPPAPPLPPSPGGHGPGGFGGNDGFNGTGTNGTGNGTDTGNKGAGTDSSGEFKTTATTEPGLGTGANSSGSGNNTGSGMGSRTDAKADVTTVWMQVVRQASEQGSGFTLVYVPTPLKSAAQGFRFTLPTSLQGNEPGASRVSTLSGQDLPDWLHFDAASHTFVASAVPSGGLPLRVLVISGRLRTVLELLEANT